MGTFRRLYRAFYKHVVCRNSSIKYGKKIGVNFNGNAYAYGNIIWGTEPWLITLGNNVHLTDGVKFLTHEGAVLVYQSEIPDLEVSKPIIIKDNVFVGNNVLILPGVTIGNNVVIGAGAIVSKDIPDDSLAVGCPARVIKTNSEFLEKLKAQSTHLGNLPAEAKDIALRKYHGFKGNTKGIYF